MTTPHNRDRRRPQRAPRGFTLVEVMISSALLSVILGGAMVVVVGVNGASERVRRVGDAQEAARLALAGLSEEIRVAGSGASSGLVGVAPSGGSTRRVPVVYSGPDVTVTQPDGTTTMITNSIYVISTEPGVGIPGSDGTETLGVVAQAPDGGSVPIQVECVNNIGVQIDCSDNSNSGALIRTTSGTISPLLVGDFANAVYMRPTSLGGVTAGSQSLTFSEQGSGAFSPDPKAPFGFTKGATMGIARVTHWYLKQQSDPNDWELVRSRPTLNTNALGAGCANTDAPFIDETTPGFAAPVGVVVGSGPLVSMQIRYIMDSNQTDDPQQYTIWNGTNNLTGDQSNHLSVCDGFQELHLREVRMQIVARAASPDHQTNATGHVSRYSTPGYDGTLAGTATDAFPRRSFEARVVPRNLQGVLRL